MKLEDQVCSVELAKRLKELGVKKLSYFKWIVANHATESNSIPLIQHSGALEESYDETPVHDGWTLTSWAAYTVAELGEMLPPIIEHENRLLESYHYTTAEVWELDDNNEPTILAEPREYYYCYMRMQPEFKKIEFSDTTEANVRAKMLIHLIENKLMELS